MRQHREYTILESKVEKLTLQPQSEETIEERKNSNKGEETWLMETQSIQGHRNNKEHNDLRKKANLD